VGVLLSCPPTARKGGEEGWGKRPVGGLAGGWEGDVFTLRGLLSVTGGERMWLLVWGGGESSFAFLSPVCARWQARCVLAGGTGKSYFLGRGIPSPW